jgi:hypothetical protein
MLRGFKSASGTAIALQRLGSALERALHLWMELLVLKLFVGNPLGGSNQ